MPNVVSFPVLCGSWAHPNKSEKHRIMLCGNQLASALLTQAFMEFPLSLIWTDCNPLWPPPRFAEHRIHAVSLWLLITISRHQTIPSPTLTQDSNRKLTLQLRSRPPYQSLISIYRRYGISSRPPERHSSTNMTATMYSFYLVCPCVIHN